MNWGYKIIIVYLLFVAGILFLVIKSSSQKMDLVTPDYYGKELKYQQILDESGRANALSEKIRYEKKGSQLVIYFPRDFSGRQISGTVDLYCPSDEQQDISKTIWVIDKPLILDLPAKITGLHELHVSWIVNGIHYYFENRLIL